MTTTNEQRVAGVSRAELERRWALVRDRLEVTNTDALVVFSNDDHLGGYARWFTDMPVNYRKAVIFHRAEPMTLVEHGRIGVRRSTRDQEANYPGIDEVLTTAEFQSVHYTQAYEAELVVQVLNSRRYRRIALVNDAGMTQAFSSTLRNGLVGGPEITDETDFIDLCMVIKSAEELALIRRTAEMQDNMFEKVLAEARPGMRDLELTALAQFHGRLAGAETGIVLGRSGPQGTCSPIAPYVLQNRVIREGDYYSLLIENNGPGGYYTELSRLICFGKASPELKDAVELTRLAQIETKRYYVPGTPCRDIHAAFNKYCARHSMAPDQRIYAHGQGYNLVERPLIRGDESMVIEAGMNLAIHPSLVTPTLFAITCDNYIVGSDGLEPIHRTEQKLFELR